MNKYAVIAANRFGLGARPGELDAIAGEPKAWLLAQIGAAAKGTAGTRRTPEVFEEIRALRAARDRSGANQAAPDIVKAYGRTVRAHYVEQAGARYRQAASTETPFAERLVHFWANHFAVSVDKQPLPAIAGLYENEAIRPHVGGSFTELLLAAERHPAMLLYLDNQRSVGPNSELGKRANRRQSRRSIGLNENLAREILELHTLGVDGGYTQDDVTEFAHVITGWSIGGAGERGRFADGMPGEFEFREAIHEPGAKSVLGKRYGEDGVEQGEQVLRDLAAHPSTARHLALKLVRHFVADDPPASLVDKLTAVYLANDTQLAPVYAALIAATEPWTVPHAKYKTPHDFVISAFRAFDHVPDRPQFTVNALDLLGQTPWRPGSPAGWSDRTQDWDGADALYKRIEWSNAVARIAGNRVDPLRLGDLALGSAFSDRSRKAIARAESRLQGTTLLLASPDFQRR
ncbi:MAG: DUF1800 domain-containing protein [Pseudomonadota bacterium]